MQARADETAEAGGTRVYTDAIEYPSRSDSPTTRDDGKQRTSPNPPHNVSSAAVDMSELWRTVAGA